MGKKKKSVKKSAKRAVKKSVKKATRKAAPRPRRTPTPRAARPLAEAAPAIQWCRACGARLDEQGLCWNEGPPPCPLYGKSP